MKNGRAAATGVSGKAFWLAGLSIFLLFTGCKKPFIPYRLIDRLEEKNIIASPLVGLLDKFKKIEQEFKREDFILIKSEENGNSLWAVPAQFPILGEEETQKPEGMMVFRDNQEIEFRGAPPSDLVSWKVTRVLQTFQPEFLPKYSRFRKRNEILLPKNEFLLTPEIFFPQAEVTFEITARSGNENKYSPKLRVFLDDVLLQEIFVGKKKVYRFAHKPPRGRGRLKIGFRDVDKTATAEKEEIVALDEILLRTGQDLILIACPGENGKAKPEGDFRAVYLTYAEAYPFRAFYNIQKGFPMEDRGMGGNPFSIKKKLTINGMTFNGLFAPPRSVLEFEMRIPEAGVLEFGYGLLKDARNRAGDGVSFQVIIRDGENEEVAFSDEAIPPGKGEEGQVFYRRIDLARYRKKKITIALVTEQKNDLRNDLSFWSNPVLYQKKGEKSHKAKDHKNVVLISIDTLRADHLRCYGYPRETSPAMDRFAEESVLFERCISTAPSTLPAHMSLMTALSPINHQVTVEDGSRLSPEIGTLAELLRHKDYLCAAFTGSGQVSAQYGFSRGFDEYHEDMYSVFRGDAAETLAQKTVQWLRNNQDKTFFLFLHTYQPHSPYFNTSRFNSAFLNDKAPHLRVDIVDFLRKKKIEESLADPSLPYSKERLWMELYASRFLRLPDEERENIVALYDGEIRYTDEYLVRPVFDELKNLGLYDDALIILVSDHGEAFFDHHMWEHGVQLYDELIRVPLIVKFPGSPFPGRRVKSNVSIVDILPTVLAEIGDKTPPRQFEGMNLKKNLARAEARERICYAEVTSIPKVAVIEKNHKFIVNQATGKGLDEVFFIPGKIELYDLDQDPREMKNLAEKERDLGRRFLAHLERYAEKERLRKPQGEGKQQVTGELREVLRSLGYIQ